jgi:hypothetical protein
MIIPLPRLALQSTNRGGNLHKQYKPTYHFEEGRHIFLCISKILLIEEGYLISAFVIFTNFLSLRKLSICQFFNLVFSMLKILHNYINESASINYLDMRVIHLSCSVIMPSSLKNEKIINFSHMISILNYVFIIFSTRRDEQNKISLTYILKNF